MFGTQISNFYNGLHNKMTDETAVDGTKSTSGKDALPFTLYKGIWNMDSIMGRTFLVFGWNLICRSVDTAQILFQHMGSDGKMTICGLVLPRARPIKWANGRDQNLSMRSHQVTDARSGKQWIWIRGKIDRRKSA